MRRCIKPHDRAARVSKRLTPVVSVLARRAINLATLAISLSLSLSLLAQVPQEAKSVQNFQKIFYRNTPTGKVPDAICSGAEANPLGGSRLELKQFELETLRDGKTTEFIAKAPECVIDVKEETAASGGSLQGFTATTNFYIQGNGFFCTKSNSLLVISNNVETHIEKTAMKGSSPLHARTKAATNETVKIFSDHFRLLYQSNVATYTSNVRVLDPRMTLNCELLTIRFGTNGSIETIVAEQNVIVTQTNGSRATGDRAIYTVVGTNETVELIGNAHWNDGQHEATARSFFYDGKTDELRANDRVKVHYANSAHRAPRSTNDFSELFANTATISNATRKYAHAQDVVAQGDVIMTNHFDHSTAQSFRAVYTDTNGVVELTGNPSIKTQTAQIAGYVLSIDRSNSVFQSRGNTQATFVQTAKTGKKGYEQSLYVTCNDLDYTTNQAQFTGHVECFVLKGTNFVGKLFAHELDVHLVTSNQWDRIIAKDHVSVLRDVGANELQKLFCDTLAVHRNPKTALLTKLIADGNCRFEQTNSLPKPQSKLLQADHFRADFSPVTNKVERFTAEGDVHGFQIASNKTQKVTGARLVYSSSPKEKIEITGHPRAITERAIISDADLFTYNVKSNTFRATGHYKITPPPGTNSVAFPR